MSNSKKDEVFPFSIKKKFHDLTQLIEHIKKPIIIDIESRQKINQLYTLMTLSNKS